MLSSTRGFFGQFSHIDWPLLFAAVSVSLAGLITMNSFASENTFFERQVLWIIIAIFVFFLSSVFDYRFLRRSITVTIIFGITVLLLLLIFVFGDIVKGAQSRFDLGIFAIQPAEIAKLVLIVLLAKYFARRHIEIAHIKHILVSGLYAFLLFFLVFLQPDFGSAIIIASIWLGMVLVAGISRKHLIALAVIGVFASVVMWNFALADYQKDRFLTFLNPLADIQGAGYNAYQSTIAVGSGQVVGKGIGYGTQSKLQFLPEYETDFIFAAFAEEWGFVGVMLLFGLFGIVIWRVLSTAMRGASNFETLFGVGVAVLIISHFIVHVGMNLGLLPVTGTTVPFMSYGGSHLIIEFLALGMLMGMRKYARTVRHEDEQKEFLGI
ncbi:MAG: rod shape-determining protein RodA [Candidatus Taylorbacteria bacterium CG10_big_fil_rev_8_21_14_0_10_41_48]|uniref:Probable peptidoglycan glycosyltransferase FtsW n=1 Tax=Candidatus Taylorbacteria bacterium CG10_big_fil_rev_8_21_14_0_10_41_48 TaxID=1975024 RepID=A0A2M8LCN4_9BACT|nr:MAG: rod shape-determining protein RodA [Candidatus Taylorbacteria bacterium CG10_big_fil_rev_8_21_14_0_10_41_48]